jgi:hypothetical protein
MATLRKTMMSNDRIGDLGEQIPTARSYDRKNKYCVNGL